MKSAQAPPEGAIGIPVRRLIGAAALSVALVIPCFVFDPATGDRPSHVYNAWLAQLVKRGEAPGLRIASMTTNTLYDSLLSALSHIFYLRGAESIATSIFVLIFFWGSFALVCASARRWTWQVAPLLAMLCYGWTFTVGLMNFYGAIGIANLAIALWWLGWPESKKLALPLGVVVWMGHPLGVAWMLLAIGWTELSRRVKVTVSALLVAAAAAVMVALRFWLKTRVQIFDWPEPIWVRTGADQFLLFRDAYKYVAYGIVLFLAAWAIAEAVSRRRESREWVEARVPAQLWFVLFAAVCILPNGAMLPIYPAAANYVASRSTVLLVLMLACLCGSAKPRAWQLPALVIFAAVFFWMYGGDMARVTKMSRQSSELVQQVPPGSRVIALVFWPESRIILYHLPDLACAGQCFSYANYEPASQQFRVRTTGPNRVALSDPRQIVDTQVGHYMVQPQDDPLFELYQCRAVDEMCLEKLPPGELNGMAVVRKGWLAHQDAAK